MTNREIFEMAISAACIKANPEIEKKSPTTCPFESSAEHEEYCKGVRHYEVTRRPIRLADVLFAMPVDVYVSATGNFFQHAALNCNDPECCLGNCLGNWRVDRDDLEQQSDETVAFISSLLTV
jgi:hypothetical protein